VNLCDIQPRGTQVALAPTISRSSVCVVLRVSSLAMFSGVAAPSDVTGER